MMRQPLLQIFKYIFNLIVERLIVQFFDPKFCLIA